MKEIDKKLLIINKLLLPNELMDIIKSFVFYNKRKLFLKDKRKSILMNCLDLISHRVQKVEKIAWIKAVISLKKAAVKSKFVLINRRWMKNLWKRLSLNKKNKIRSCKKWNKKNRICYGKKRGSSRRDNRNKMRGWELWGKKLKIMLMI